MNTVEPKPDFPAKRVTWRGTAYDSQLECDWAASLTKWGVDFKYHPGQIYLSTTVWEPDFHVEGRHKDILCEVKGYHNHRLDKALEARALGYEVMIGRPSVVIGGNDVEFSVAQWEGDYVFARSESGALVVVAAWAEHLFDEVYWPAGVAVTEGKTAIRAFKAIGSTGIV